MILTPEIEQQLVATITADPTKAVTLPDWAYGTDERVVVLVDGLPIDLHRHLHNILIRPLGYHERMWQKGNPRNVNPHLFDVVAGRKSPRTECPKKHPYEGNEAPPNSRGYRCLTCYVASRTKEGAGPSNKAKTHCPNNHKYTRTNTIKTSDGRRRCRKCTLPRKAAAERERRARLKRESQS